MVFSFLFYSFLAPTPSRRLERASSSKAKIFAIVVPSVIVALMICGLCGFLRYLRSGRVSKATVRPCIMVQEGSCSVGFEKQSIFNDFTLVSAWAKEDIFFFGFPVYDLSETESRDLAHPL